MKRKPKQVECQFCERSFHPKGIFSHRARCKARPENYLDKKENRSYMVDNKPNFMTMSPHARLIKAANDFWESAYDHQKLRACAFILFSSDKGL